MTRTRFIQELHWAHWVEVFGQPLYRSAARFTRDARQKEVWEVLEKLEIQTRDKLAYNLEKAQESAREPWLAWSIGTVAGAIVAVLPWKVAVWSVGVGAKPVLRRLERLRRDAGATNHSELLDYLVAHERAQIEFVKHELAGDSEGALAPVLALLPHRA